MPLIKESILRKLPFFVPFILRLYVAGLLIFGALRIVLLMYTKDATVRFFNIVTLESLQIGLLFDTVSLAYTLALPLILLFIQSLIPAPKKLLTVTATVLLCIIFPLMVFIAFVDIPYFKFFNNRLSEASLQWMGDLDIVLKMITGNTVNLAFLIIALLATFLTGYFILKYCRRQLMNRQWQADYLLSNNTMRAMYFLLMAFLCFMGMRGTISHPLSQSDSFYSNNLLLNQIGLNPTFTLMKSLESKVNLMDQETAIKNTREILQIHDASSTISPIVRQVKCSGTGNRYNIVLVLMESMSANYMGVFGNPHKLTPALDSLTKVSWFFRNAYSAGIHTNNGIFSSLYSFPALRRNRPMSTVPVRTYSGLPYTLKQNGYRNMFFSTHYQSFDNIGTFIPNNFFDELHALEDYPRSKVVGPFGVPDDFVFSYAIKKLNLHDTTQPFFATILTTSNHDPYALPAYFKSPILEKDLKAVNYADWSINKFMTEARTCAWFDNTLFVFVSDHGLLVGNNPYDLPLSYHHIPIIMHGPKILKEPKVYDHLIGQIDLFPTIMGILNIGYTNNTLGVNVLEQQRNCIYFSADDKIGCIDHEWLYIYRYGGTEGLYQYRTGNTFNFAADKKTEFERLKKHALSQTQVTEWMISNDKTSLEKNVH